MFAGQIYAPANECKPLYGPYEGKQQVGRFAPGLTLSKGQIIAQITSAAVNATQTITPSGTISGGTFTLTYNGQTTVALAYNSTAAQITTALENLPNIGPGNVLCSGSALPGGTITITFQNLLGGIPTTLITYTNSLTGSSPVLTVAAGTTGVSGARFTTWNGTRVTDPTTGPSVSATTGGTMPVGTYLAQMAWYTAEGETLPSQATSVIVPDATNDRIRFAAITSGNVPTGATGIKYYLNGVLVATVALSSGAVPQTDVDALPTSGQGTGRATVNTAYVATDGTHIPRGILRYSIRTDNNGLITFGDQTSGEFGEIDPRTAPFWTGGVFRNGDVQVSNTSPRFSTLALTAFGGRVLMGKADLSENDAVVLIPAA